MNNRTIFGLIAVLVLVLAAVFYFWNPFSPAEEAEAPADEGQVETLWRPEKISANHYYADGNHTISGTLNLPNPCLEVTYEVFTYKSLPPIIEIRFTSQSRSDVCTQVIADKGFSIPFQAEENVTIRASWNGEAVELVLTEAGGPGK